MLLTVLDGLNHLKNLYFWRSQIKNTHEKINALPKPFYVDLLNGS